MSRKKSFREKLADDKNLPRVVPLTGGMARKWGPGTILIPAPSEVSEFMRSVPEGKLMTINQMRDALAQRHSATLACPMVTGILARVVAGAAAEDEEDGMEDITPYWRTLKTGGEVNPKYPGGIERQESRLADEGHRLAHRGKRVVVVDFEQALMQL